MQYNPVLHKKDMYAQEHVLTKTSILLNTKYPYLSKTIGQIIILISISVLCSLSEIVTQHYRKFSY